MAKIKIELNSSEKLQTVLQEAYDLANSQIKYVQDELSKLTNSTPLKDTTMDEKSKYYKSVNDLLLVKDKAIGRKVDISKLLSEILKYNGSTDELLKDKKEVKKLDFSGIRDLIEKEQKNNKEVYKVK
jgi:hypothetical protein